MAKLIAIMGESGSGKTTAMRTLDPAKTFYVDADGKGLSWKGWKTQYNSENKNYFRLRDINVIGGALDKVSRTMPDITTIIVDTLNTAMVDKEVKSMGEKGYDKWCDLAQFVWNLIESAGRCRDDLTIIFTFHAETVRDDTGYTFTHIKTNGRKLEKLVLESLFTTVLYARVNDNGEYVFTTKFQNTTAKAPFGALADEVPNDMQAVLDALEEY